MKLTGSYVKYMTGQTTGYYMPLGQSGWLSGVSCRNTTKNGSQDRKPLKLARL